MGRHAAPRDWWPAVLACGAGCLAGGMWLLLASFAAGVACYSAGAWLSAAWIGHDITVRLARRRCERGNQTVKPARGATVRR